MTLIISRMLFKTFYKLRLEKIARDEELSLKELATRIIGQSVFMPKQQVEQYIKMHKLKQQEEKLNEGK